MIVVVISLCVHNLRINGNLRVCAGTNHPPSHEARATPRNSLNKQRPSKLACQNKIQHCSPFNFTALRIPRTRTIIICDNLFGFVYYYILFVMLCTYEMVRTYKCIQTQQTANHNDTVFFFLLSTTQSLHMERSFGKIKLILFRSDVHLGDLSRVCVSVFFF